MNNQGYGGGWLDPSTFGSLEEFTSERTGLCTPGKFYINPVPVRREEWEYKRKRRERRALHSRLLPRRSEGIFFAPTGRPSCINGRTPSDRHIESKRKKGGVKGTTTLRHS